MNLEGMYPNLVVRGVGDTSTREIVASFGLIGGKDAIVDSVGNIIGILCTLEPYDELAGIGVAVVDGILPLPGTKGS